MKRLLWCMAVMLCSLGSMAQNDYISFSPYSKEDRIGDLNGAGGVLVLSKRNDLVITVTNARSTRITPKGMRSDGLYEYEVVVDRNETKNAKIEINRRGDVYKTEFVAAVRADFFRAYLIEEVANPIRIDDQTQANDAILNKDLAAVEFSTPLEDLKVECPKLLALGAKIERSQKQSDKSIHVITVTIPVKILDDARNKYTQTKEAHDQLNKLLVDDSTPADQKTDSQWEKLDRLEAETAEAGKVLQEMTHIAVYTTGSNHEDIDISELGPRSKKVYAVVPTKTVETVHISECSGFMEEGGRLFGLREYEGARSAFCNALAAKDAPESMKSIIQTNINQCDTCTTYEKYTLGAFGKIKEIKATGGSQEDAVKYASAAIEYLQVLNRYNPCDFYSKRITQLETLINNLPLEIRFTTVRWVNDASGFFEAGKLNNVEIWAFKGHTLPAPNAYKTDKKFAEMVKGSSRYEPLGSTNAEGQIDLRLDRNALPTGFFLRPTGYGDKIKIYYISMKDLIHQSQGTYNKRQFRVKMFAAY